MKIPKSFLLSFLSICLITPSAFAEEEFNPTREWTSADGSVTLKGKVLKYDGEKVTIQPVGKKAITSKKEVYSEADIDWLDENKELIGKKPAVGKDDGKEKEDTMTASKDVSPVAAGLEGVEQINKKAVLKKNAKYYFFLSSASWCGPCCMEAPGIVKEYKRKIAKDPDVELVLLSADKTKEDAEKWAKSERMTFPIYFGKPGQGFGGVPGVSERKGGSIPSFMVVDNQGKVIHNSQHGSKLKETYSALAKEKETKK